MPPTTGKDQQQDARLTVLESQVANLNSRVTALEGTPADTTAPTVPTGLTATVVSSSQINLAERARQESLKAAGLALWSNPCEVVLTPFMGIGSEVYSAVGHGRKGVGVELKPSYYRQAVRNVESALKEATSQAELTL